MPQTIGLEETSTLGVGWASATQTLQQWLFKDYYPPEKTTVGGMGKGKEALLVYSAATNTGMHIIQQARVLYPQIYVIAVASSQHHSRLQDLGADACFDYHSKTIENDVGKLGKNVTRAIDCHSEGTSSALCAKMMGDAGSSTENGRLVRTLPPGMIRRTVPPSVRANEWIVELHRLGEGMSIVQCKIGFHYPT